MMKVRFGRIQVDCIAYRLNHLAEMGDEDFEELFVDYDWDSEPYTESECFDAFLKLQGVFCISDDVCKKGYNTKNATLDTSIFNTDGLKHAAMMWLETECISEYDNPWYAIQHGAGLETGDCVFKTENEILNFESKLIDKVDNIDWGFENDKQ